MGHARHASYAALSRRRRRASPVRCAAAHAPRNGARLAQRRGRLLTWHEVPACKAALNPARVAACSMPPQPQTGLGGYLTFQAHYSQAASEQHFRKVFDEPRAARWPQSSLGDLFGHLLALWETSLGDLFGRACSLGDLFGTLGDLFGHLQPLILSCQPSQSCKVRANCFRNDCAAS